MLTFLYILHLTTSLPRFTIWTLNMTFTVSQKSAVKQNYRLIKFNSYSDVILTTNKIPLRYTVNAFHVLLLQINQTLILFTWWNWDELKYKFLSCLSPLFLLIIRQCRSMRCNLEIQEKCILQSLIRMFIYYFIYFGFFKAWNRFDPKSALSGISNC